MASGAQSAPTCLTAEQDADRTQRRSGLQRGHKVGNVTPHIGESAVLPQAGEGFGDRPGVDLVDLGRDDEPATAQGKQPSGMLKPFCSSSSSESAW